MLAAKFTTDTPLPLPGSTGYLRGTAHQVTVIQRGSDGRCTVKLHQPRHLLPAERLAWANRGASLTTKVDEADIYATEDEAIHCGRPQRARRTRKPRLG